MKFKLQEYLPKEVYDMHGEGGWSLVDVKLVASVEAIKERFPKGTMTINNWSFGGNRNWSGLRTPDALKYYSKTSQHSLHPLELVFKAIDAIFSDYDANEVRQYIIDNPEEFPYIKGIEMGVSWLHIDTRNRDTILLFKP